MTKCKVAVEITFVALVAIGSLGIPACRVSKLPFRDKSAAAGTFEVEWIKDIVYYHGLEDDSSRHHQLDLFLPKDHKGFPVVVLIHGGAWMVGDNRCCGLFSAVGQFFAG